MNILRERYCCESLMSFELLKWDKMLIWWNMFYFYKTSLQLLKLIIAFILWKSKSSEHDLEKQLKRKLYVISWNAYLLAILQIPNALWYSHINSIKSVSSK